MAYERSNNYSYEVALGHADQASVVDKFGFNTDIDTTTEEIIASFGGAFDPTTAIIDTAQTFTITYNNVTDGLGTTGALSLEISYIDENSVDQTSTHILSNTGSDVTSFTGFGINRVKVLSVGSAGYNTNDITITATTDATTQALVPATLSITQQAIYHNRIDRSFLFDFIYINILKISGGGQQPLVNIYGYAWDRANSVRYRIFDTDIDTSIENTVVLNMKQPYRIPENHVVYFTAVTDENNTKVNLRFGGVTQPE